MKLSQKVYEYFLSIGAKPEDVQAYNSSSVYVAQAIAIYAHRNQKRLNGAPYVEHPFDVLEKYRALVEIVPDDSFCLNLELLNVCCLPYEGVQEVCMLHDVLEDTEVTLAEIEEYFDEVGLKSHFEAWIKTPLLLVTHDKSESYEVYIDRMLPNAAACMVKFADLASNINFLGLDLLGDKEFDRLCRYARYAKTINDKWHFLEGSQIYRRYRKPLEQRSREEQEAFYDWLFDWEEVKKEEEEMAKRSNLYKEES